MKQLDESALRNRHHNRLTTDEVVARAREQWMKLRHASEGGQLSPNTEANANETGTETETDVDPASVDFKWVERTNKELDESQEHCRATILEALQVSASEHMSEVDRFDGKKARGRSALAVMSRTSSMSGGKSGEKVDGATPGEDLVKVRPVLDGRLRDLARPRKAKSTL